MVTMARKAPLDDPTEDNLEVGHRQHHAAGVPAVLKAMKTSQEQMGVRRTALTLLRVNQPTGFDCPGCAWPDPGHTHTAEFCENGAKAVAEEATLRRVDRDFFARHDLADLAARSDYWLGKQGRLTEPMHKAPGATHCEPIDWHGAFAVIAERLHAL